MAALRLAEQVGLKRPGYSRWLLPSESSLADQRVAALLLAPRPRRVPSSSVLEAWSDQAEARAHQVDIPVCQVLLPCCPASSQLRV